MPMALSIDDAETERLARMLARRRHTSVAEAVHEALREGLRREDGLVPDDEAKEAIMEIARRSGVRPRLTGRTPDEIVGHDERGLSR
jgi:antitoxin VapB